MQNLFEKSENHTEPAQETGPAKAGLLPRRFYTTVEINVIEEGFSVTLDGKTVKTPARNLLKLPTQTSAEIVADEFRAQKKFVDPSDMPATRLANTAIDGVAQNSQLVLEDIVKFAATDLLCYRAASPQGLVQQQAELWDPVIDWLASDLGANFILAEGVMHVQQPREAIAVFSARLKNYRDAFQLACLHVMTSLSGSAFLALALAEDVIDAQTAWRAAHIDEDWNIAQWGEDQAAADRRAARYREFNAAWQIWKSLGRSTTDRA
jgi:chaperone required for assembly of F1-ATPase